MSMKRWFVITVIIMASLCVGAQSLWDVSKPDRNFTFGLRAGLGLASTDQEYATSTRTSLSFGASADWNIVKSISLSTGLSFIPKGFKSNYGKGTANYLQVPVLIAYRIETPTGVLIQANIGPYFAWGVSGTIKYKPYDMTFNYDYDQDSFGKKGFFKHNDFGLTAGANVQIGHVLTGVSYDYGLADIAKVYGSFHNRYVMLLMGYNF